MFVFFFGGISLFTALVDAVGKGDDLQRVLVEREAFALLCSHVSIQRNDNHNNDTQKEDSTATVDGDTLVEDREKDTVAVEETTTVAAIDSSDDSSGDRQ